MPFSTPRNRRIFWTYHRMLCKNIITFSFHRFFSFISTKLLHNRYEIFSGFLFKYSWMYFRIWLMLSHFCHLEHVAIFKEDNNQTLSYLENTVDVVKFFIQICVIFFYILCYVGSRIITVKNHLVSTMPCKLFYTYCFF